MFWCLASTCQTEGMLAMLNSNAGLWMNVFTDLTFGCDGMVTGLDYYSQDKGTVSIGAYEKVGTKYYLRGEVVVTAPGEGVQVGAVFH